MNTQYHNVYQLRKLTHYSVSLAECRKTLEAVGGDVEQAKLLLQPDDDENKPIFAIIPDDAPTMWAYILTKVNLYLKIGPDIYRIRDYFEMPSSNWDQDTLEEIENVFRQFAQGNGYKSMSPVENVSVGGFYAAMTTLHFELIMQSARCEENYVIDEMLFEHRVDKRTITVYNKIPNY